MRQLESERATFGNRARHFHAPSVLIHVEIGRTLLYQQERPKNKPCHGWHPVVVRSKVVGEGGPHLLWRYVLGRRPITGPVLA